MRKGFTLIELLVVVLIIGILAAVAVPQYQLAAEKSRASQGIVLAKSLAEAQKVFFMANGYYTSNLDDLDISVPGSSDSNSANIGNFTIRLHNMDDSNAHIEIANNSWSWWFIIYYLNRGEIDCAAKRDNKEANRICRTFNSVSEVCPEPAYNCYSIH